MPAALHPQNGRVSDRGRDLSPGCKPRPRHPAVYISREDNEKHRTPLCPELSESAYWMLGTEEGLYLSGERWCETCRMHNLDTDGSGWTDLRYQRGGSA